MSKTREPYQDAARHHEGAASHYKGAGKFDQAEEHEEAAHHASLAHTEAAKLHAEHRDSVVTTTNERDTVKNAA
jgi:hypothetical protein